MVTAFFVVMAIGCFAICVTASVQSYQACKYDLKAKEAVEDALYALGFLVLTAWSVWCLFQWKAATGGW